MPETLRSPVVTSDMGIMKTAPPLFSKPVCLNMRRRQAYQTYTTTLTVLKEIHGRKICPVNSGKNRFQFIRFRIFYYF